MKRMQLFRDQGICVKYTWEHDFQKWEKEKAEDTRMSSFDFDEIVREMK